MNALKASGVALQVLVLALMGACAGGGGGGGGGGGVLPPPPASPPTPRPPPVALPPLPPPAAANSFPAATSQEYINNWGPAGIGVQSAWQYENAHGEGVLIGVIDDGIHPNHPELQGRIHAASIDIVPGRNALVTNQSHGSELSSLIAGNFNNSQTVGVAYESTILAIRADNGVGTFNTDDLANALDYARVQGARVVNFSLGSGNPTGATFQAALDRATAAGMIIVVSAGNDGPGATNPNYPGFLATNSALSRGLIVIAGGLNPDGTFNTRSNPAGSAAQHYLTAPGWQILVPDYGPVGPVPGFQTCGLGPNGDLCQIQGTSYASPHVTGAVAVLMSAFPGLSPNQVVELLKQTTDDMGPEGIDSTTGWGRLNLARAFQPVGTLSIPLMAGMAPATPDTMLGMAGPAFGDGLTDDPGEWGTVGFDKFQRTFQVDLASGWVRAPSAMTLATRAPSLWRAERAENGMAMHVALADDVAPDSYRLPVDRADLQQDAVKIEGELAAGLTVAFAAHGAQTRPGDVVEAGGHLAFVNSDQSLRLTRQLNDVMSFSIVSEIGDARIGLTQERVERSAHAAQLGFDFGRVGLNATFGEIEEEQGVLGLSWSDAVGETPGGGIRFAGFAGHVDLAPQWRASFEAETGVAEFADAGWLAMGETLRTSAFGAELAYYGAWTPRADGRGMLTLSLSQPMRVESGTLVTSLPNATNYGRRSMRYETREIDPTPSGREVRLGLGYRYFEGDTLSAFGEVMYIADPGHVAQAEDDTVLRVGLRMRN